MKNDLFSAREKEVIQLLLQGRSNKQIARSLHVAERTVEFHLGNVYAKLGVASRTEAVLRLAETGLWVSTGGKMRESAVESEGNADDNGSKSFSTRRPALKNILYIAGTIVLTTALIVVVTLLATSGGRPGALPEIPSPEATDPVIDFDPTGEAAAPAPSPTATPESVAAAGRSSADVAEFVSETYPDWTNIPAGTGFTKTWTFRNAGTTTWTTDYALNLTSSSHPLGQSMNVPETIGMPGSVAPGETVEIPVALQAPAEDGIYSFHWQMQTGAGQIVSGDGSDVWVTFTVGEVTAGSSGPGNISLELIGVDKSAASTDVHVCAQYPDTQDWNPRGVTLSAGSVQASIEGYSLDNAKAPTTGSSTYRCFTLGFAVGTNDYGSQPVQVTIASYWVDPSTNQEANCARARQQLAGLYPGLDFTCGPAGYDYSNLVLPGNLTTAQADQIIMDALSQAISGPWVLSE